ncbi:MAG: hypothetical protein HZA46_09680 [Planctomycetales bacterium]|nr:hypothetical protein [Planctomycetales bacterium]
MFGDLLIRWTIRLSLAAYVGRLGLRIVNPGSDHAGPWRIARGLWSAGCVLSWLHVVAAFHFEHHWSQTAAWEQTARETAAVIGLNWGGGIFFNYAFLLAWAFDTGWWWLSPGTYARRPNALSWLIDGYLAFIAFNATVVFKTGWLRWVAVAVSVGLLVAGWWWQHRRPNET